MQIRNNTLKDHQENVQEQFNWHEGEGHNQRVFYLNAYECELGYGGPEEGGWWYDIRIPKASVPITKDNWRGALGHLYHLYEDAVNSQREHRSAAGGYDIDISLEETFAEESPQEVPHYC